MGLLDKVKVTRTGCLSLRECEYGPLVVVYPEGVWHRSVTVDDVTEIIEEHLIGYQPLSRLLHFKL